MRPKLHTIYFVRLARPQDHGGFLSPFRASRLFHRSSIFVLVILFGEVFVKKRRRFETESVVTSPIEMWPMF